MTKVTVQDATAAEAPILAEIRQRLSVPARPVNPEHFDFSAHRYLLALENGTPVGYLNISLSNREGDPEGKYWAYATLPLADEAAALHALYERLEALPGVRTVFTMTHESLLERQSALTSLGYRERLRSYGADLEVGSANLQAFGDPEAPLRREGVHIHTLAELQTDPAYADKLYALYLESSRDVPEVGHTDTMSRTAFEAHLKRDDALPEAYHVAVHDGRYIGYSELFRADAVRLRQETTAVLAPYRRRGIALALKRRGLAYAQRHGYTHINTGMASNNTAMVTLNTRLGFVPQAAYITFSKGVR